MLKIKLFSLLGVLGLVGTVLLSSQDFKSEASEDVIKEVAGYKTWKKLVKPPIENAKIEPAQSEVAKVEAGTFQISDSSVAG